MATSNADLNWIANYTWGIADDVLRDLYVRGKYRDVVLPMTVLRRLDAVLKDSKQEVLDTKALLDKAGMVTQDAALRPSLLQHVDVLPARPARPRQPPATHGRLPGLPLDAPVRSGDQRRDLRHLQGRPAAEGRG